MLLLIITKEKGREGERKQGQAHRKSMKNLPGDRGMFSARYGKTEEIYKKTRKIGSERGLKNQHFLDGSWDRIWVDFGDHVDPRNRAKTVSKAYQNEVEKMM